jgi:putative membrane protein
MPDAADPRVYFAAERTLLAWLRTGLTIMGFGFVVARFGLFLRLLRLQQPAPSVPNHGLSPYLGAALVLVGVCATAYGGVAFRRYCQRLRPSDLPGPRAPLPPLILTIALVLAGLVLAAELLR